MLKSTPTIPRAAIASFALASISAATIASPASRWVAPLAQRLRPTRHCLANVKSFWCDNGGDSLGEVVWHNLWRTSHMQAEGDWPDPGRSDRNRQFASTSVAVRGMCCSEAQASSRRLL